MKNSPTISLKFNKLYGDLLIRFNQVGFQNKLVDWKLIKCDPINLINTHDLINLFKN